MPIAGFFFLFPISFFSIPFLFLFWPEKISPNGKIYPLVPTAFGHNYILPNSSQSHTPFLGPPSRLRCRTGRSVLILVE